MARSLKILYWSCHEILEFDDLRMLTDQGHEVFSLGVYADPAAQGLFRRPLPQFFRGDHYKAYCGSTSHGAEDIDPQFAARFDVAFVNHMPQWIEAAIKCMNGKPIVYRSIGQSNSGSESLLRPMLGSIKIVRYSEREVNLPGFLPADRVIYFGKPLEDFSSSWVGGGKVVTFHNGYKDRSFASTPSLAQFVELAESGPYELWGASNEGVACSRGMASPAQQVEIYRTCGLYLYVPTVPPSYTLSFMEAMGTGVPILAPTAALIDRTVSVEHRSNAGFLPQRYEIESLLGGDSRLLFGSVEEIPGKAAFLLGNKEYAAAVSITLRRAFAEIFDARKIGCEWSDFLEEICENRVEVTISSPTDRLPLSFNDIAPVTFQPIPRLMMDDAAELDPKDREPVVRHRWARRELFFALLCAIAILIAILVMRHGTAQHIAPGQPIGQMPR